jgi:NADH-quinone oxidoreductase subunit A
LTYTAGGPSSAWPLLVYAVAVLSLMAAIIAVSYLLGQRHSDRETADPYESGVSTTGTARLRFSIRFYLVAMFFVIFDVESAFLFAWAIAFRRLGWGAYIAALVFALTLLLMVFYLARTGGLDFIGKPKRLPLSPGGPASPVESR